jgi:hypothetical protein
MTQYKTRQHDDMTCSTKIGSSLGLEGSARVFQGCDQVTRVLQGCYKGVTRVLQGCYLLNENRQFFGVRGQLQGQHVKVQI